MKTNIFKSSIMALAMVASFSACTQDELGTEATTSEDALNVIAYSNDFISSDTESRVTEDNYTTKFEENDAIGIFIVRDGQALVSNMKMTLGNDGAWKGENNSPLYYYKDADYIAYYPYIEGLTATSESDIVSSFTTKVGMVGQATKTEYEAADLMTASVEAADVTRGESVTFNFDHKMSMIEVKVPVRAYTTTGGYSYKAPLGLQVNAGDNTLALCCVGSDEDSSMDVYRCIVAPSETALNIDGQFQDGAAEVYFPVEGTVDVIPSAGKYKGININYTYADYNPSRDLKVGDFFYADGSIYPGDLTNTPKTGCIGIIFSTDVQEEALTSLGYNHGYVVSIVGQDVDRKYDGQGKRNWNSTTGLINTATAIADCFSDRNAYSKFSVLLENNIAVAIDTKSFGTTEKTLKYAAPEKSTGWILPTTGLIIDIFNNLSTVQKDNVKWTLTNDNAGTGKDSTDQEQKVEMINELKALFESVGGGFVCEEAVKGKDPNISEWWWSSTEEDESDAYIIEFKTNGQAKLLDRQKSGSNGVIRPVFAF